MKKSLLIIRTIVLAIVISALPVMNINSVNAASISGRSVALSNPVGDASGVTYTLSTAALLSSTAVKSVEVKFCAAPSGSCVKPAGFANASSTLASQPTGLGAASGWTVSAVTDGSLRILNASNATTPSGAVSVVWNGVHNPTAVNATFYGIITTYSDSGWTTPVDSDGVALSTAGQITVTANVDETLTFTLAAATVGLGSLTSSTTGTGVSSMTASTNAATGYSIAYSGTTLTSGSNTIAAMASPAASTQNSKQFGINLMANTTPAIGSNKSGSGTGAPAAGYGTSNSFKFNTAGETIASAAAATNSNTFTTSYIANVDGVTPGGAYSTVITYVITANY